MNKILFYGKGQKMIKQQNKVKKIRKGRKTRADLGIEFCIKHLDFNTVLDVGCGDGFHSKKFIEAGKIVTSTDIGNFYPNTVRGFYEELEFQPHDLTWASHVLEHQLNINNFLKKLRKDTKPGGFTCVTVPPLKHQIVGGHVSLWNAGLIMYNLVLAGFNCKNAHIKSYNYNITVVAQADEFELPTLNYDSGDITRLKPWLPDFCEERFDGHILDWNWRE